MSPFKYFLQRGCGGVGVGGECQYLSCVNTHTHTHFYILQLKVGKSFVRRQTNKIVGVQCKIGGREKTSDCALISSSIFFFFEG